MKRVDKAPCVELMVRPQCGSCHRVAEQIKPVVEEAGARLSILNVEDDIQLNMEYGDRVPVVVIEGEEFACWEVDNDELAQALLSIHSPGASVDRT
ncbi:glutaredoxin family protein [Corynebacterium poyangense]|uniref:Glutaredoxin family protein n=1 Tax=Corynebacterium poyangense TaxID=2684405 RepID=A0A7H0SLU8_9CORY|nr:glutaredoxin family protein [Corynebacterium poyangense]MBZ8177630.1 glutaredoxin family protein [Corynebacterium poyangense]QNQ89523.1 glutaredoxin family protein [Corynebacterium poyangense]